MYTCLLFHLADHIFRVSGFRQNLHTQRQRCDSVNWNTLMNGQDISSKFSNGVACIDMIEKAEADYYKMILMDIQMPVMNGYDAALAIRKMKDTKKSRIPIVAMTANAFAEDTQKALSVGMNAHVAKPVDMNILVPTMMKYL